VTDLAGYPTIVAQSVLLDGDGVRILDRRIFPFEVVFVHCRNVEEVAVAIEEMVTQSNGPFFAAGAAMVLAAREAERTGVADKSATMIAAAERLRRTRPTNNNIRTIVDSVVSHIAGGQSSAEGIETFVRERWQERRDLIRSVGVHAAGLVPEGGRILTHCWSEGALIETLRELKRTRRHVELWCTETRPYLQGARLTSHSAAELGIAATVITDGMVAHAMQHKDISLLMTAADRVTLSGHVFNKVGTLTAAIAARHFAIPYVATVARPDAAAPGPDDVHIEERDGEEVLHCMGMRTASPLVQGWYPAFDATPPELVSAVVTTDGVFAPLALAGRYAAQAARLPDAEGIPAGRNGEN
jgi:methylthioribose-1-phosphate isomerase